MGDKTQIEWADATWGVVTGCEPVSPGCLNCYAAREAAGRLAHLQKYAGLATRPDGADRARWTGEVRCHEDILLKPLSWARPRRVFVASHGDLFHPAVPDNFLDHVFAVMAEASHHVFQVLTKRPERAARYLKNAHRPVSLDRDLIPTACLKHRPGTPTPWPLPNVWLGTTVEDQERAARLAWLLQAPAAVRWASLEPLIGPVDLFKVTINPFGQVVNFLLPPFRLDWLVVGGESGARDLVRPCAVSWVRDLVDQARMAEVPVFVKQLGAEWAGKFPTKNRKGADPAEWPADLRVQQYPETVGVER